MSGNTVWMREAAAQRRFGVKGPGAAAALAGLDLAVPDTPNTWSPLYADDSDGGCNIVGRLGNSEFFVEECDDAPGIAALEALTAGGSGGAYPVLRADRAMVLGGPAALEVMAEVCNVDFSATPERAVLMTSMIGVSVLVLPQQSAADGTIYRIWCDPSFGSYLWEELGKIVTRTESGRAI